LRGDHICKTAVGDVTPKKQFLTRSHEEHEEKHFNISRLSSWLSTLRSRLLRRTGVSSCEPQPVAEDGILGVIVSCGCFF